MNGRSAELAVFIEPPSRHFYRDALFDRDNRQLNRDGVLLPFVALRDWLVGRGLQVHTADLLLRGEARSRRNLYITLGIYDNYRPLIRAPDVILSAAFQFECPIVDPAAYRALRRAAPHFRHVFSWSDGAQLERFVGARLPFRPFSWPQPFDRVHEAIWRRDGRKHLVMINSNKRPRLTWQELYRERLRAVAFFARKDEIDLYGMGWNEPPAQLGRRRIPAVLQRAERWARGRWQRVRPDPLLEAARRVCRGPLSSKSEVLGSYDFALCFENMILKGWITEKIFDCFYSGTVPIYWGAPDIAERIPRECFIDMRHFGSYEELREHLRSLTSAGLRRHKEAARDFLRSPGFRPFHVATFIATVARVIEEDAGIDLGVDAGGAPPLPAAGSDLRADAMVPGASSGRGRSC